MSRGPDRSEIERDHEWYEQERHQRRLKLMRMQGDLSRQESRLYWYWAIAITLGMLAFLLACI